MLAAPRLDRILRSNYPDYPLLASLKAAHFGTAIPEHEFIQFRRLQSLIYAIRPAGYDVEAMQTEAFLGAVLSVRVNCKVAVTRCEYDQEINDAMYHRVAPRLARQMVMWFTTNANLANDRVRAFPIGITDYCGYSPFHAVVGDTAKFKALIDTTPRSDRGLVLLNFKDGNHESRPSVRALFGEKPFVSTTAYTADENGYVEYVRALRSHTFCLAPRGNGIDTHRMWEALYAGCIPIVQRSLALKDFADLPIFFVDDWAQAADEATLLKVRDEFRARTWDLRKLTLSYWFDEVCACLSAVSTNETD